MNPWIELALALLQGLTEPLPISSSGHLVVAQAWLNVATPSLAFEAFVNLGSVLGVIVYYRTFILSLLRDALQGLRERTYNDALRYMAQVAMATLPAGLAGWFLNAWVARVFGGVMSVGLMLLFTGALLFVVSRLMHASRTTVSSMDALVMGVAQAAALIPGLSRSGLTTVAGLMRGLEFRSALRFSLMMYLPISLAAGGWSVWTANEPFVVSWASPLSLLLAAIGTYGVIGLYTRVVEQHRLVWFAYYCTIAGALVVVLA
jgi:undecaprenyl-diphosphatase